MTDHAQLAKLLTPFPKEAIGKLPKGGAQLDYVGHAAITKRLLEVDPEWSWEPLALNEEGLPQYDKAGGLWIRLTVCGVTRLGYGDGPDPKQRIGDALRNAAMRFGVALDLWSKEEITVTLAPEEVPWWVPLGWASEDEHNALRRRVSEEGPLYGDAFAGWWKARKYKWPISVTAKGPIEEKLAELATAVVFPDAEVVG